MKLRLHFLFLLIVGIWALIGTIYFAATKRPKSSIGSAIVLAVCSVRASRTWDELQEERLWEDLRRHPRI